MAEIYWYYARNDQQVGPLTSVELKRLASVGEVFPDDLVWREGMDEWAPASRVKGLFAAREPGSYETDAYPPRESDAPPRESAAPPRETLPPARESDAPPREVDGAAVTQTIVASQVAFGGLPSATPGLAPAPPPADAPSSPPVAASGMAPSRPLPIKTVAPVPEQPAALTPGVRSALLAAQGILWGTCVLVVILGGVLFMMAMLKAESKQDQAAAAQISAALFIGAYALARAGERACLLLERFLTSR